LYEQYNFLTLLQPEQNSAVHPSDYHKYPTMSVYSNIIKMLAATIVASLLFAAIVSGQRDITQWIDEDPAGATPLKDRDSTIQPLLCGTQYYDPLKVSFGACTQRRDNKLIPD
jgi:hypothetical protein